MENEILYKNEKLTKRLLELKSEKYKLTCLDGFKLKLLEKISISHSESELIDKILAKEGHLSYARFQPWTNEFNQTTVYSKDPYISKSGLIALKKNYYEVSFIMKKLNTPQTILTIIMTILTIFSMWFGIRENSESTNIKKELEIKKSTIDSLNNIIIKIQNKNIANDSSQKYIKFKKDTLNISETPGK